MCPSVTIKIMNFLIKKVKFTNKFFHVYARAHKHFFLGNEERGVPHILHMYAAHSDARSGREGEIERRGPEMRKKRPRAFSQGLARANCKLSVDYRRLATTTATTFYDPSLLTRARVHVRQASRGLHHPKKQMTRRGEAPRVIIVFMTYFTGNEISSLSLRGCAYCL